MTMRLAFAVAAHLEPEILIVDEVLAVGDAAFQRKCVSRMGEVIDEGRTVLVVSHNMAMIQNLCARGIMLKQGRMVADGPIEDVVATYLRDLEVQESTPLAERDDRFGDGLVLVTGFEIGGRHGVPLTTGRPARIDVAVNEWAPGLSCVVRFHNELGYLVCSLDSGIGSRADRATGRDPRFGVEIDELPLVPGRYRVDVEVQAWGDIQDQVAGAALIDVEEGLLGGRPVVRAEQGDVAVAHRWIGPEP
jgi:lipopolysaccharide transport system ATP-binding protein